MKLRALGRTGILVPEVGFGSWAIGGNEHGNSYGPTRDDESIAAITTALDMGCRFFDTADVYGWGHSEELLGQALEGWREEVVIATKVGGDFYHGSVRMNFDPSYLEFALERSLERLRTDHIDIYQLHNPPMGLLADTHVLDALERFKEEGRVRSVGVSIHVPQEALAVVETGRADALQLPFSIFRQEWIDTVFPLLRHEEVGVICREPLANGFLAGKYGEDSTFPRGDIRHGWPRAQLAARTKAAAAVAHTLAHRQESLTQLALKFCLHFPEVSVIIPGAKTPGQVQENLSAAEGPGLTKGEVLALRELLSRGFQPPA